MSSGTATWRAGSITSWYEQYGPDYYDKTWAKDERSLQPRHLWAARFCRGRVLDVGCGVGWLGASLRPELRAKYVGLDFSAVAVEACWRRGLNAYCSAAEQLPAADRSFNTVVALEVLEHVEDVAAVMAELKRVARGRIIVSVPPDMPSAPHRWVKPLNWWQSSLGVGQPDYWDGSNVGWVIKLKDAAPASRPKVEIFPEQAPASGSASRRAGLARRCREWLRGRGS